jgi:hypothetical protein
MGTLIQHIQKWLRSSLPLAHLSVTIAYYIADDFGAPESLAQKPKSKKIDMCFLMFCPSGLRLFAIYFR